MPYQPAYRTQTGRKFKRLGAPTLRVGIRRSPRRVVRGCLVPIAADGCPYPSRGGTLKLLA